MNRKLKLLMFSLVLLSVFVTGFLLSQALVNPVGADSEEYEKLRLFTEVYEIIKRSYVEEVEPKKLIYGAIKGMLKVLDPHSGFMPPEAYKEMKIDTKGEFGGLGIHIGVREGMLTVIAPIEDTPAWRAGIKAGDKIIKVNGEPTRDMTLLEAVNKMRGPKGTKVTITIIRKGWKEPRDFTIVRDIIKIKSVKYKVIEGIGYVKISQFHQRTASELENALKNLKKENIDSLVLDLRNNPGGLLQSAVEVAEQFLPPDRLVVYIKGRTGKRQEYYTRAKRPYYNWPMIILVNHGSASASEIVAGAMKDWHRAVLLGTKTFGKGSVQSIIQLNDGSGLRLTTAKYYTPKGISIQNKGIEPDIVVKLEIKEEKALPVIREKDLKNHLEDDNNQDKIDNNKDKHPREQKEFVPLDVDEKNDIQLQRAIDLLKGWKVFKENIKG